MSSQEKQKRIQYTLALPIGLSVFFACFILIQIAGILEVKRIEQEEQFQRQSFVNTTIRNFYNLKKQDNDRLNKLAHSISIWYALAAALANDKSKQQVFIDFKKQINNDFNPESIFDQISFFNSKLEQLYAPQLNINIDSALKKSLQSAQNVGGFASSGRDIIVYTVIPVFSSNNLLEVRGLVVLTKIWGAEIVQQFARQYAVKLRLEALKPQKVKGLNYDSDLFVTQIDERINFSTYLKDLDGWIVARVVFNADIETVLPGILNARKIISAYLLYALAFSTIVSIIVALLVNQLCTKPLREICTQIITDSKLNSSKSHIREVLLVQNSLGFLREQTTQSIESKQNVLGSIADGYQLVSLEGDTLEVNQALCNLLGISAKRFCEQSNPFFYLDKDAQEKADEFLELMKTDELLVKTGFDAKIINSAGVEKVVSLRINASESEQSNMAILVIDQSQDSDLNLDQKRMLHLKAVADFSASAAHDLNNLLTGIVGAVSIIESGDRISNLETLKKMINSIKRSAQKATELTADLLLMAKIEDHRSMRSPVDVLKVIKESVASVASMDTDELFELDIKAKTEDRVFWALADEKGLCKVLTNIILNSCDAYLMTNQEPTSLEGSVKKTRQEKFKVDIQLLDRHNNIQIVVRDYGCGMSNELIKRIFDPFFSTKKGKKASTSKGKLFGGTGLGLSTASNLVEVWGGTLTCNSALGEGSSFIIELPQANISQSAEVNIQV